MYNKKYLTGVKGIAENEGMSKVTLVCPACREETAMHICKCTNELRLLALPIKNLTCDYLITCPKCAEVFTIDNACVEAYKNGNPAFLTADRLVSVKEKK